MKAITSLLLITASLACSCLGGNLGPGPWANGAYYPGQFNGVYTASMFGGSPSIVSGLLGFGVRNGSPSTLTNTTTASTTAASFNANENFYVVYVDGRSYAGIAVANINSQAKTVSGSLATGQGEPTYATLVTTNFPGTTNQTVTITPLVSSNSCGGAFTAKIKSANSVVKFTGDNTGTISTLRNGTPVSTNTFSVNGMKVGN